MKNLSAEIKKAASLLKAGALVAFPTETVYGLGGNALADETVASIYAVKERPHFNPLIVHVPSAEYAKKYVEFNETAEKLAAQCWPGPLTMVLPRRKNCKLSLLVSAGLDCVAMRVPAHPLAQAILAEAQIPVAAPSANRSGRISPTEAEHVREELGNRVAMVVNGGPCVIGIESTVIDLTGNVPIILRPGAITQQHLEKIIGPVRIAGKKSAMKSPGMMERHYAPTKPLRLHATEIRAGEALLAFGPPLAGAAIVENLSVNGSLQKAAANLFRMLRKIDASAAKSIAVMPIPEEGLGVAINDRLRRAATIIT